MSIGMQYLSQFPVVHEQKVAWGDMDAFGHVNNVMYYRYIESARICYFEHLNLLGRDVNTVVASSQCKYIKPVFYPDTLSVGACVVELRNSAMRMEYSLYSHAQAQVVATGEAVVVFVDQVQMNKTLIPNDIRESIIQLEKKLGRDLI